MRRLTCISSPVHLRSGTGSAARRRVSAEDQPRRAAAAGSGGARGLLPRARDGAEVPAAARAGSAGAGDPERYHLAPGRHAGERPAAVSWLEGETDSERRGRRSVRALWKVTFDARGCRWGVSVAV